MASAKLINGPGAAAGAFVVNSRCLRIEPDAIVVAGRFKIFDQFPDRCRRLRIADVWLYPSDQGGKSQPVFSGWGCPCKTTIDPEEPAWDGWPIVGEVELRPGETGRFGWMFLSDDNAASTMKQPAKFYLWEGRIIGEAVVVTE